MEIVRSKNEISGTIKYSGFFITSYIIMTKISRARIILATAIIIIQKYSVIYYIKTFNCYA